MAIYLEATLPSGERCGYHRLFKAEADFDTVALTAIVQSWPSREDHLLGNRPKRTAVNLPF